MTAYTWSGGYGFPASWSDPGSWTPSGAPGAGDQATIAASADGSVAQILGDGAADQLSFGGTVELTSGAFRFGAVAEQDFAALTIQTTASLTTSASGATGDYVEGQFGSLTSLGAVDIAGALVEAFGHVTTVESGSFTVGSVVAGVNDMGVASGASYYVYSGSLTVKGDFSGENDAIVAGLIGGTPPDGATGPVAAFTVLGTTTLGGDAFFAGDQSSVTLTHVAATPTNPDNNFTVLDSSSWIEIGGAHSATGGQFMLDAGETLAGGGSISAPAIVIGGLLDTTDGLELDGALSGAGLLKIEANGGLTLNGAIDASAGLSVSFAAPDGALTLDAPAYDGAGGFAPVIAGFQQNDFIVLNGVDGGAIKFLDAATVEIDVGGAAVTTLRFQAGTDLSGLQAMSDGAGDTLLSIPCFCAGVRIATPQGERKVEELRPGDPVVTLDGGERPILWIGRRVVSARFADPARCWPVRVTAGALGENLPRRDLLLSPDHALLIDGALVHAGALVNGGSIRRETRVPEQFVYYHVELVDHALLFAEGAPAESFIDNQDRMAFDNWREHEALWPQGRAIAEMRWPRIKSARQLPEALRRRLAAISQARGVSAVA